MEIGSPANMILVYLSRNRESNPEFGFCLIDGPRQTIRFLCGEGPATYEPVAIHIAAGFFL
jgi:hypothetical protein